MFSKYQKTDVPSWQRKLLVLLASLFAATLLMFVAWAVMLSMEWIEVDDCLDKGGRYDYERGECDFQANDDT